MGNLLSQRQKRREKRLMMLEKVLTNLELSRGDHKTSKFLDPSNKIVLKKLPSRNGSFQKAVQMEIFKEEYFFFMKNGFRRNFIKPSYQ